MKWLTNEYDRLYKQVKEEGKRVICYVDSNFGEGELKRDICTISRITMQLQTRTIVYGHPNNYKGLDEEIRFIRMCEKKHVQWLDESEETISLTKEALWKLLINFGLAYEKSTLKDISNDASEYLTDYLKWNT